MKKTIYSIKATLFLSLLAVLLNSCQVKRETSFNFTLICSEDLLQFVTPTAKWTDAQGKVNQLVLTNDMFSDKPQDITVSVKDMTLAYWREKIMVESDNTSCEMTISYTLKDNAPDINAKDYAIYNTLYGSCIEDVSTWAGGMSSVTYLTFNKDENYTGAFLKGEELKKALDELVNNPDYLLLKPEQKK